ncbi:zinc finger BED domain-containing protein RICESLEEPER 2-like [Rhododendron vialii]|uniref:zinc finger BED domain-containing protein RICESLEEPER 2-like n=1 Tax=Rhododendron vialii TaxID=182163 RepID=UPI00265D639C|nr:zinc finger BED domain-containing protein RICESLEEPER 2-like [Rhododendron vialii]
MSAVEVDSSTTLIDCIDESNDVLPPPSPTVETHEEEIDGVVALLPGEARILKANLRSPVWLNFDKVKTMKALEKYHGRVVVTTDMWTTSNQKRGYMVITAHFIDDSWNLQSHILRFVYVPCPHTAQALCDAMMDTFLDWNIDRKLSTITVHNCSTNHAMVSILLEKFDPNCLWWSGSLFHVRCAAHILNLILKDGLEVIKEAIEKIRDSVAFWTATPEREIEETICQLRIPFTKTLPLDCATWWNSTYLMLQTAIEYKDAFSHLKHRDTQYKTVPTENDWKLAVEICGRLKVFYNVTELFSRTRYPTANLLFAKICEIKIALSEWVFCDNVVVQNMSWKMEKKYDKYWQNIHGILGVVLVLDPRYKMTLIEYSFRGIFGIEAESKIETVL